MDYHPEIDGLRAVAVLPVIFFHFGFASFSGGYIGVDVFFVISGYLPALFLVILVTGPVMPTAMLPDDRPVADLGASIPSGPRFGTRRHRRAAHLL